MSKSQRDKGKRREPLAVLPYAKWLELVKEKE